jgi:ATP-binding cassette subfamily B protein
MARNRYFEDEEVQEISGKTLARLLGYLRPYKWRVALSIGLVLVAAVASQIGPVLVRRAVDVHMPAGDTWGLVRVAAVYAALLIGSAYALRHRLLIMVHLGNVVIEKLREEVFSHVNRLSFKFFDDRPAGKIIHRIMVYVDRLQQLIKHGVVNIVADMFRLVIIFAFMVFISPRLTLIALAVTPFLALFVFLIKTNIRKRWDSYQAKSSNVNAYAHESFIGIKVTQAFVREQRNSEIMREQLDENYRSWIRAVNLANVLFPAVLMFNTVSIALVYWFGYRFLGAGTTTLGTLIAFSYYIWMITEPIVNLSTFYNEVLVSLAAAERVFDYLDTSATVVNAEEAYELPEVKGRVEFRDVVFGYESSRRVFDGMSFVVEPGQTIALVGETGAGKSTIINLLTRFYDIQGGHILVDGQDVRKVTLESLRRQVGVMMQDSFVFSGTVAENIRYGRLDASRQEIEAAARAVHAHEFIAELEAGYDTEINEAGSNLSIGQRQLLAFARTLLSDPRILILDEATASIDTHTEILLQQAIARVLSDRTSFVVAHRLSTIRSADQIFVIDGGRLIESGTHKELLDAGGKYRELHESQYALADMP